MDIRTTDPNFLYYQRTDGAQGGTHQVVDTDQAQTIRGKLVPINPSASGLTLTAAQSGTVCLFDNAAGVTYTLPTASAGLTFTFWVTTLQTSSANVVYTGSAAIFALGAIQMFSGVDITPSATLGPFNFAGNGTTHLRTTTNGTTTGGAVGSWQTWVALSATQWYVTGVLLSPSGSLATPFSV